MGPVSLPAWPEGAHSMKKPIVIIGMGEMGQLFARGFLRQGHPVYPVLRGTSMAEAAAAVPDAERVLAAVGEEDLHGALEAMPSAWRGRLVLLQNELLPRDWQRHGISDPTVIVVWFDQKKGRPPKAVLPSLVCGAGASSIIEALRAADVPCSEIASEQLLFELVKKNLYILTVNIGGLRLQPGATVAELWEGHRDLAESLAKEILDIQEWLAVTGLPRERLMAGLLEGFAGDPNHICTGRSAPQRLRRALRIAGEAGLAVPVLRQVAAAIAEPS